MVQQPPQRLILASGSRGRRYLMERAGYRFEVFPANIDEPAGAGCNDIRHFVHDVSWRKAAAIANQFDDALILAADTVGWIDGEVIGKPDDEAHARQILAKLGGREHELWTGVTLWRRPGDMQIVWQEMTRVAFKQLSPAEMDAYLATRIWVGCSGAYAIQEDGDPYVRIVAGSMSNVIGLPMESLSKVLGSMPA